MRDGARKKNKKWQQLNFMSATINETLTLETAVCWKCGIMYAVPSHFLKMKQEDKSTFYCPNGHGGVFGELTSDTLKRQLEIALRDASAAKMREQSEREQKWAAETERDRVKRASAQMKKRIAAGVCPCCNRTFENLQRHIHAKHPDFSAK